MIFFDLRPLYGEEELAQILESAQIEGLTNPDSVPDLPSNPVTVPGDLWILGKHRLMCGDSTFVDQVQRLFSGVEPILMVTDPPYGVDYDPKIVNVARLHILRRMGQYLAGEDFTGIADETVAERCKTVLERAYGMADLERSVPNDTATVFDAGSVAKQFTAAAVLLLAQRDSLSLDDDVRRWLPEVPTLSTRPISIHDLLHHTSGLREWGVVAALRGWPVGTAAYTNAHVLDIVAHQRSLNFEPGAEFLYSNTNYNLLAVLVQRVTERTLADYTRSAFFQPLHMLHTRWREDYTRVVPHRAVSYMPASARMDEVILAMPGVGSGPTSRTSTPMEQMPAVMAYSRR